MNAVLAPTLVRRALYEDVAERLRAQIFARQLEPGAWIDEMKLAAEYGISRTPLREALKVLAAEGLVKTYRRRNVVNNVAVNLRQGEIVGLLGPNGAGKTTTFYMIVGLIAPDAGRITLGGEDVTAIDFDDYFPAMTGHYRAQLG